MTQCINPLVYYFPVLPKTNTELSAVVSHINDPSDFYIQLVWHQEEKIKTFYFPNNFFFCFVLTQHFSLSPLPHQVDNMESLLLSAKLQDFYSASTCSGDDELNIFCPVIGQACVARFEDKLWYRAQVIGNGVCACQILNT